MTDFTTSLFMVSGPLAGIWLQSHIAKKNSHKATVRQKAIEAYALVNRLPYGLISFQVTCRSLLQNPKYMNSEILENTFDTIQDMLGKLELIIVENFFDLNQEYLKCNSIMLEYASYLINIQQDPSMYKLADLDEKIKKFKEETGQDHQNLLNNPGL
jgi:hypothetical protein